MRYHFDAKTIVYPGNDDDDGGEIRRFTSWVEASSLQEASNILPDCLCGIVEDLCLVDFTPQRVALERLRWVSDDPRFDN